MPVERKPLFRAEILAPRAAALPLGPESTPARETLRRWAAVLGANDAEARTESELLPDYLSDVFYGVLGYRGPAAAGGRHTLSRERRVEVDGKFADAVLGDFGGGTDRALAVVEGKGPRDPLDRPFAGRRMSAVDQAYRYAINLRCDWILVTNLREIRLYHKSHDQRTFERFTIADLAAQDRAFSEFVYLLGAERVIPEAGPGHLAELLLASERADLELTRSYYAEYSRMRREILGHLRSSNPAILPDSLLLYTQKLLDRVLFIAFAEDRGLLPPETLKRAFEHRDPYNPRTKWETFKGLFRAIDQGNGALGIPGYNGGLFSHDHGLDALTMPDDVFFEFKRLGDYDYRSPAAAHAEGTSGGVVDVEILGHIFEQSITDLEQISQELAKGSLVRESVSRRRREGAFYTPRVVTRFIVGHALHRVLDERFAALRRQLQGEARGAAVKALDDPRAYDPAALSKPQKDTLLRFWEAWIGELERVRVLDPACGSGAFLIEAFDHLHAVYQEAADRLYELRGSRRLFDPDRTILEKNLYGVDLNEEAIEICRLSIWIKTAERGKRLTDLDRRIRSGNSLIADPEIDPRSALDWRGAFPEAFADGGFDVVVGNPPYVRQELLGEIKPYLGAHYRAYHGVADLYVYFFERGLELLKPGGRLSFVVTNKWLRAGYAEPLRRLLAEEAWPETLVDLGHSKRIFPDADVFPSIVVLRKPAPGAPPPVPRVSVISRDEVRLDDLERQVEDEGFDVPRERLGAAAWALEPAGVEALMEKLRVRGAPLAEYVGAKPLRGVLTGLNEAFLIDTATREKLIAEDGRSAELLKPYLRGQDVRRWRAEWNGLWMILLKSSDDHEWPWSGLTGAEAEHSFAATFPALHRHLTRWRDGLAKRWDKGRFWWELRTCSYYAEFERPKVVWQEIQYFPAYAVDATRALANNKVFFIPRDDSYLVAVLNSPLLWWHNWRYLVHLKDEALTPSGYKMEQLPVAPPTEDVRAMVDDVVRSLLALIDERSSARRDLLDWLRVEHHIANPSRRLAEPFDLPAEAFVHEVRHLRGKANPLTAAALRSLRDEHARTVAPVAARLREAARLEADLSSLVCRAYGLTPEEIDLMWRTAPPRMPAAAPAAPAGEAEEGAGPAA
jgi:SAM-dependent methyltransferase